MTIEIDPRVPPKTTRTIEAFADSLRNLQGSWKVCQMEIDDLPNGAGLTLETNFQRDGEAHRIVLTDEEIVDARYTIEDWDRRRREMARRAILEMTGLRPAWGILTGVRPSKLYRMLRVKGFSPDEITQRLVSQYYLHESKAVLLREVGKAQEVYATYHPSEIGVYLGIPFCPTRCRYCSFASQPLGTHGHLVKPFVRAVLQEITAMAERCREFGWTVRSIYVGGGTPTAISAEELREILLSLRKFPLSEQTEYTVEAGRPETMTDARLKALVDAGVNRISVNPQTMHEATLRKIGRSHTVDDVFRAVDRVRRWMIPTLNMDLIAGLPGEDLEMISQSLAGVIDCRPENITVHTLAPKRAAEWSEEHLLGGLSEEALTLGLEKAGVLIRNRGYHPYYLYRQRRILADQENIGYSLPGQESLYNIWMMEETRTILGLGGGAITKWVHPKTGFVERWANPKCPATFAQQIEATILEKAKWLKGHL